MAYNQAQQPYVTLRSRMPATSHEHTQTPVDSSHAVGSARRQRRYSQSLVDPEPPGPPAQAPKPATHDTSRVSFHVKHLGRFAKTLEESATRAFPNRGRASQRYKNVQALLLHWGTDDLFVLPELEDLERCLREDYSFSTDIFSIPSENSHLELMMRLGKLIKDHESQDTLFLVYYGGHARIDESRQSTWCATRNPDSPWLQWSAIQTLLERSASDVLILLDCCAGAASATFPTGSSITETISASSWDAIAPDPGRYSFTNALIEVMQEWRLRTYSAAMLHAEVLARLKHPRPITINGKLFEARSTPVHFMMTSNHRAPSIELSRVVPPEVRPPSPPQDGAHEQEPAAGVQEPATGDAHASQDVSTGRGPALYIPAEPNEDTPHVMISLALEDDQQLDLNAWEQWLANFPAMAKYVKVQGVFKSHSTLLLLSMPVMVWDLLPEDHAASFIAFIRSNNLVAERAQSRPVRVAASERRPQAERTQPDTASFFSDTTYTPTEGASINPYGGQASSRPLAQRQNTSSSTVVPASDQVNVRDMIPNQQRSGRNTVYSNLPEPPKFSQHVEARLEQYYQSETVPNDDQKSFVASNLGIERWHIEAWFHHRRERDVVSRQFESIKMGDIPPPEQPHARSILAGHLNKLLEVLPPKKLLIVDVRTPTEFERAHIDGAVNLRVPRGFLRDASFDMIERSLGDKQSRRRFAAWQSTACLVVCARAADTPAECPSADALFERFRGWGWGGRCFVLKGHFREFSVSYSRYITGTRAAPSSSESPSPSPPDRQKTAEELAESEVLYRRLLAEIDNETAGQHGPSSRPVAAMLSVEQEAVLARQEEDLEAEFAERMPDLYRKAKDVAAAAPSFNKDWSFGGASRATGKAEGVDDDNFDLKAPMVEHLDRGLDKIRQQQEFQQQQQHQQQQQGMHTPEGKSGKLAAEGSFEMPPPHRANTGDLAPSDDSYVEVGKSDHADAGGPAAKSPPLTASPGEESQRRGGRSGFFSKVLRRT